MFDYGFWVEVAKLLEIQFDFQVAFAFEGVRNGHIKAWRNLAKNAVKVVAVDFHETALFEFGQRRYWFTRKVCQQANNQWEFFFLDGVTYFNVIGNLYARRAITPDPVLKTIRHR